MANKKNKVKFGLQNVYWCKITEWGEDPDGNKTVPVYGTSVHLPGAVSLSIDANGEAENFYGAMRSKLKRLGTNKRTQCSQLGELII